MTSEKASGTAPPPSLPVAFTSGVPPPAPRGLWRLLPRGPVPPDHTCQWILEVYGWLLSNQGGFSDFKHRPLVLPTDAFFPVNGRLRGNALAVELCRQVVKWADVEDWNFSIQAMPDPGSTTDLLGKDVAFGAGAPKSGSISGMETTDDGIVIRYAPHLAEDAETLISAIAYEVARAIVFSFIDDENDLPGVEKLEGPLLEVVVTFLGFGVFSANSVFRMESVQNLSTQGWKTSALGELRPPIEIT